MSDFHFVPLRPHALARAALVDAQGFAPRRRASVTRSTVDAKDTSFTIETVQMQDKRERGYQDLGQMLEGVAGVNAGYGAWYDSIFIRGSGAARALI